MKRNQGRAQQGTGVQHPREPANLHSRKYHNHTNCDRDCNQQPFRHKEPLHLTVPLHPASENILPSPTKLLQLSS